MKWNVLSAALEWGTDLLAFIYQCAGVWLPAVTPYLPCCLTANCWKVQKALWRTLTHRGCRWGESPYLICNNGTDGTQKSENFSTMFVPPKCCIVVQSVCPHLLAKCGVCMWTYCTRPNAASLPLTQDLKFVQPAGFKTKQEIIREIIYCHKYFESDLWQEVFLNVLLTLNSGNAGRLNKTNILINVI